MRPAAALLAGLLVALTSSCGGSSAAEKADAAQAAFTAGKYADARARAEEGLSVETAKSDKALAWRLERLRVEAIASSGDKAKEVLATLTRLTTDYATQADASYYAKVADELGKAGNLLGAIDVVESGKKHFPSMATAFDADLAYLKKAAEGNDAAMEKLKTLGYLGGK